MADSASPWTSTTADARDLHRSLLNASPEAHQHHLRASQTVEDLSVPDAIRLYPEIGSASGLAQPGGFRRAFVQRSASMTTLVAKLTAPDQERTPGLTPYVMHTREDGQAICIESRGFRLGQTFDAVRRDPSQLTEDGAVQAEAAQSRRFRLCGFRMHSVPYWSNLFFAIGSALFSFGSFAWMTPRVGDSEHGAPEWAVEALVTYPFFVGALFFTSACYLALVACVNANLHEELREAYAREEAARNTPPPDATPAAGTPPSQEVPSTVAASSAAPSSPRGSVAEDAPPAVALVPLGDATPPALAVPVAPPPLRWWAYQPHSILYWGVLAQFVGALAFQVATTAGLPDVLPEDPPLHGYILEASLEWAPSVLGSFGFSFCSYVYLAEVTHSYNPFTLPARPSLGYFVCLCNLLGSLTFLIASIGYFARPLPESVDGTAPVVPPPPSPPHAPPPSPHGAGPGWIFEVSEWGVRFTYGIGSVLFFVASMVAMAEVVNEADQGELIRQASMPPPSQGNAAKGAGSSDQADMQVRIREPGPT